jgi:hypothetical protein
MANKEVVLVIKAGIRQPTGADVQRQMTTMRIRCIARYKLTAVPGRPEELVTPMKPGRRQLGISFGYGCKTIRVRTMVGRQWTDHVDFQIGEGWGSELYAFLDRHFGPPQPVPFAMGRVGHTARTNI